MLPRDLGQNRLRSGFFGRTIQRSASHPGTPSDTDDEESPVEIHDLEIEDDDGDGGMTLNLQGHEEEAGPIVISDDEVAEETDPALDSDLEEGEEREDTSRLHNVETRDLAQHEKAAENLGVSFIVDPTPSVQQQVRLKDLSPVQLGIQMKYAFWQLNRDEIDLNRPARCLHCQAEGHIDENCSEKTCAYCNAYAQHESALCPSVKKCQRCREPGHSACENMKNTTVPCDLCTLRGHTEDYCPIKHYNRQRTRTTETSHLWISCCACASKSHLVGDCPEIPPVSAPRWSLRLLDPNTVTNLNLQTGMDKREKEAESRDLRPEGMRIRGRADRHNAEPDRHDLSESDDLENFFSRPRPRRDDRRHAPPNHGQRLDQYRPGAEPRYDRYEAPTDTYRPPRNTYYATDSFGRPRSRSPPRYDQYSHGRSRSQSPSSYGSYRPHDEYNFSRRSPPAARNNSSKRQKQQDASRSLPSRGFSMQLPTRKGSNPNLQTTSSTNLPRKPPAPGQVGANKASNKRKKSGPVHVNHDMHSGRGEEKGQDLRPKKKKKNKNKKGTAGAPG